MTGPKERELRFPAPNLRVSEPLSLVAQGDSDPRGWSPVVVLHFDRGVLERASDRCVDHASCRYFIGCAAER